MVNKKFLIPTIRHSMKFVSAIFSISLFIIFSIPLSAQEQLGLRFDNYSGINGVTLNPTNNLTSPFKWDINLVAVGIFGENNYGYIENTSAINLANANNISVSYTHLTLPTKA